MPRSSSRTVTEVLTELIRSVESRETDGTLLSAFVERHDPVAFAELVNRHGPMVFGVCLRVLRHRQDAEDAFQATFLVLATKAATVSPRDLVGNWLHGVALQTAVRARAVTMTRRRNETQVVALPEAATVPEPGWDDVAAVLDEELGRLPDHYRAVLVLSDVEGRSRKDVAAHLKCPEGSVASRLSRARAMLARRLSRRGVTLPAGAVALLVGQNAASAGVPASLARMTVDAAGYVAAGTALASGVSPAVSCLTNGVLKAMLITKLKPVALAGMLLVLLAGAGAVGLDVAGGQEPAKTSVPSEEKLNKAPKAADGVLGTWQVVDVQMPGYVLTDRDGEALAKGGWEITFTDRAMIHTQGATRSESEYRLDLATTPKGIDILRQAKVAYRGIYERDGDRLRLCMGQVPKAGGEPAAPKDFTIAGGEKKSVTLDDLKVLRVEQLLYTLKRVAKPVSTLDGLWTMSLPAGFRSTVRLERIADDSYQLHTDRNSFFAGRYRHDGDRLTLSNKDSLGRELRFVWKFTDMYSAELVEEPPVGLTSASFLGASLKRVEPGEFHPKKLIGGWTYTKVEGMETPPDARLEFFADGGCRQSFRRDGQSYSVEGTHALTDDQLTLSTVQDGKTTDTKTVSITKLSATTLVFTDNGKAIELTKDRFQFHPEPVSATDLKIGITAGKTVAGGVGPEKQKLGLQLDVTIKNDSKSAINTLLPREWHGGKWPPTALYAAVAPAGAKEPAAYHPVYRFGESSAEERKVTIEAGKTHMIEIRADWPGTGSVPANPLIDKPGKYSARFALVFEVDGKQQVIESESTTVEYPDPKGKKDRDGAAQPVQEGTANNPALGVEGKIVDRTEGWSEPVNRLQARLVLVEEEKKGIPWLAPYLELRSVDGRLNVRCETSHAKFAIVEADGKTLRDGWRFPRSGPHLDPGTVAVPLKSSIRLWMGCTNWGVPGNSAAMVATDSGAWSLGDKDKGKVFLRMTLSGEKVEDNRVPIPTWHGKIELSVPVVWGQPAKQSDAAKKLLDAMEGLRTKIPPPADGMEEHNGPSVKETEPYLLTHLDGVARRLGVTTKAECVVLLPYLKDEDAKLRYIAMRALEGRLKAFPASLSTEAFTDRKCDEHRKMVLRYAQLVARLAE